MTDRLTDKPIDRPTGHRYIILCKNGKFGIANLSPTELVVCLAQDLLANGGGGHPAINLENINLYGFHDYCIEEKNKYSSKKKRCD